MLMNVKCISYITSFYFSRVLYTQNLQKSYIFSGEGSIFEKDLIIFN